ncbi:hypothetical protein PFLUV_G00034780 [Perca fluviatilis]|uniref:Uncharacterized protein n=1 Tax=Perca fluviatilis TaxID=8168 RepID=A0A6A5FP34_PERFL|nr:hypothetical protein PFLUV_G00034780 [Perca fluviatilis]
MEERQLRTEPLSSRPALLSCSPRTDHSLEPEDRLHTARCAHYRWRPAREFDTTREMFLIRRKATGFKSICESQRGL